MFLIYMMACATHYYNAEARVVSVSSGGSQGEFFVGSELYCGPLLWPRSNRNNWYSVSTVITQCQTYERKNGRTATDCDNVADTKSLGLSITDFNHFKVEKGDYLCPYLVFIGPDLGESGWTPTEDTYVD